MKRIMFLTLAAVALIGNGCATSRGEYGMMKADFPKYGFLGEYYEKLQAGDKSEYAPAQMYLDPRAKELAPTYTKMIITPVVFFRGEEGKAKGISQEDAQILANYLHQQVYLALKEVLEIVDKPGPNTLRLSVALIDAEARWVGLDTISTILPQMRAIGEIGGFVTGKPNFVGSAMVEYKTTDAQTGKVLAAGIDRRVGGKTLGKGFDKWDDVTNIMDYWAAMARYRICALKKQPDCEPPKA